MASLPTDNSRAQPPQQLPPAPGGYPANKSELDSLLREGRYNELQTALSKEAKNPGSLGRLLNWERDQFLTGAGTFIAIQYSQLLWHMAAVLEKTNVAAGGMRDTSAMLTFYTFQLIWLDGTKCADPSAPGKRQRQFLSVIGPVLKHVSALGQEQKEKTVDTSILAEQKLSSARQNDAFLCRDGLQELAKGIEAMESNALRDKAGSGSRQIVVPSDPAYQPKFLDRTIWLPKQASIRKEMRSTLLKLVATPK
jgi:hypothetical protein